jgi:hypothetical protein
MNTEILLKLGWAPPRPDYLLDVWLAPGEVQARFGAVTASYRCLEQYEDEAGNEYARIVTVACEPFWVTGSEVAPGRWHAVTDLHFDRLDDAILYNLRRPASREEAGEKHPENRKPAVG